MRDTAYYDAESKQYSSKRYPEVPSSYIQSFYLRRLAIARSIIAETIHGSGLSLVEIGCADGVVTNALYDTFSDVFSGIAGVDISAGMIEVAQAHKGNRNITFGLRDTYAFAPKYDLIVEVGVINYADENEEISFARKIIADTGFYLCSIAGTDSLQSRLKRDERKGFDNFHSYAVYEAKLRERFEIVKIAPVGLFIPYLWRLPALARIIQPIAETIMAPIAPSLFHEKLYLLKPLGR